MTTGDDGQALMIAVRLDRLFAFWLLAATDSQESRWRGLAKKRTIQFHQAAPTYGLQCSKV